VYTEIYLFGVQSYEVFSICAAPAKGINIFYYRQRRERA